MKPVRLSIQHMIADAVRFLRQCQRDHMGQSTNFYCYSNLIYDLSLYDTNLYFEWHRRFLPLQEMASSRRAAQRRALTSITFTLLTISRPCLNCRTGWNLVLKGLTLLHSVSHGRGFQSHPSLRTWTPQAKTLSAVNGDKRTNVSSSRTVTAVSKRTKNTSNSFRMTKLRTRRLLYCTKQ